MKNHPPKGFSVVAVFISLAVITALSLGGWYIWQRNQENGGYNRKSKPSHNTKPNIQQKSDESDKWVTTTSQGNAFSMKVPDGWHLIRFPADSIGGLETNYIKDKPASIETSTTEYMGHSLRFRASIVALDDAGLGPQWASPQPELEETTEEFSIGFLKGRKYTADFQSLHQTIYEYVFDVGNNKKLDIVYTVYHDKGEKSEVTTVEKAIKTILVK